MKSLVAAALALFSVLAHAGTESMVAQCEAVMRCDLCRVANDPNAYPNGIPLPIVVNGQVTVRRIPAVDYNWIRNAGDSKVGGRYLMCVRVEEAMRQPESPRGIAARSLFNANWVPMDYCPLGPPSSISTSSNVPTGLPPRNELRNAINRAMGTSVASIVPPGD